MSTARHVARLYVLTGVSGSGKTTVQRRLSDVLNPETYACHDLDDIGLPDNVDYNWMAHQVDQWLSLSRQNAEAGRSTVLSGLLWPALLEDSLSFSTAPPVRYCVFKVADAALSHRLNERFSSGVGHDQGRRVTGMSPTVFVQTMLSRQNDFLGWFRESRCDWIEFDTSSATLDETVEYVMK